MWKEVVLLLLTFDKKMTKKHYKAIAKILFNGNRDDKYAFVIYPIMQDLANYFAQDNPRFDRERFLEACGYELPQFNNY